jgi:hypothetical protein
VTWQGDDQTTGADRDRHSQNYRACRRGDAAGGDANVC